ncbi:MAG: amino acid permease [Candidatus Binatia bacterium]
MWKADRQENLDPKSLRGGLGTFAGVFTPSILTILGIILFRRLGYVVGSAGLERALGILALCSVLAILTSLSLSAIATNLKVKGGGPYYLISRTLGLEFGGAIGAVLFLAQSVSIAFYCIGFAETVTEMLPIEGGQILSQGIAGVAVLILLLFAWLGTDWATRLQYLVMSILGAALLSFFVGGVGHWNAGVLTQNWSAPVSGPDFWILFAIFFPAVTGFTQGVSMSGDLKDPGRSIQVGTFLAVGISIIVYLAAGIVLAGTLPREHLVGDYGAMKRVAQVGWLIEAGVIAATLSSAMASFLGAPRILQSIAGDRIFPFLLPFAEGVGPTGNPRRGVLLSAGIALATVGLGTLNVIASVVSMFFLISYGLLNYATFYEARTASPSFRPRFRFFDARLSLLGAMSCLAVMLTIDLAAGAVALAVLFAIYQYLKRSAGPARWADSHRSYCFQRIRENLLAMAGEPEHPRDWRPCILAFCDDPERLDRLLRFASWIEGGSGLTTAVRILEGEDAITLQHRDKSEKELQNFIQERGLSMFARVMAAPDFRVGVESLLQSFGIGGIRANMVLLNRVEQLSRTKKNEGQVRYGRQLQEAIRLGCNVVVLDSETAEWATLEKLATEERRIDIWWWGDRTSQLALLLAYLMTRGEAWGSAKIRVLAPSSEEGSEKTLESLRSTLGEVRIDAEPVVVLDIGPDTVVERSAESALVFLPLRFKELQLLGFLDGSLDDLLDRLPPVALTLAAKDIDISAEPDEGKPAEIAKVFDAAQDAEQKALKAEQEADALSKSAEEKLRELQVTSASDAEPNEKADAERAFDQAKMLANKASQRAQESRAEAGTAAQAAKEMGAKPTEIPEGLAKSAPRESTKVEKNSARKDSKEGLGLPRKKQ